MRSYWVVSCSVFCVVSTSAFSAIRSLVVVVVVVVVWIGQQGLNQGYFIFSSLACGMYEKEVEE